VVPPHRPVSRRLNPLPAVGEESNGEERVERILWEERERGCWNERKMGLTPILYYPLNRPVLPLWTEPVLNPAALGSAAVQSPIPLFCTPLLTVCTPSISFFAIFMHFKFPLRFFPLCCYLSASTYLFLRLSIFTSFTRIDLECKDRLM